MLFHVCLQGLNEGRCCYLGQGEDCCGQYRRCSLVCVRRAPGPADSLPTRHGQTLSCRLRRCTSLRVEDRVFRFWFLGRIDWRLISLSFAFTQHHLRASPPKAAVILLLIPHHLRNGVGISKLKNLLPVAKFCSNVTTSQSYRLVTLAKYAFVRNACVPDENGTSVTAIA